MEMVQTGVQQGCQPMTPTWVLASKIIWRGADHDGVRLAATLVPKDITIRPPRRTLGLSTSLTDFTQAVPSIRPPFGLTMQFDALEGDDVLAYRAIHAALEGRANLVRIPLFDVWYAATAAQIMAGEIPHDDGTHFPMALCM
jgi:hypothetical protein